MRQSVRNQGNGLTPPWVDRTCVIKQLQGMLEGCLQFFALHIQPEASVPHLVFHPGCYRQLLLFHSPGCCRGPEVDEVSKMFDPTCVRRIS